MARKRKKAGTAAAQYILRRHGYRAANAAQRIAAKGRFLIVHGDRYFVADCNGIARGRGRKQIAMFTVHRY